MKYYLYDSRTSESINSTEAQPISLLQARAIFSRLEFDGNTFLGFVRDDGRVLQFAGENDRQTLLVDMPMEAKNGSLQMRTVKEAGQELIQEFFEGKDLEEVHKFQFCKWR